MNRIFEDGGNYTLHDKPVRIAIRFDGEAAKKSIASAIKKMFLTPETRLYDIAPDYLKDILTH